MDQSIKPGPDDVCPADQHNEEAINLQLVRLLLEEVWGNGSFHLLPKFVAPHYVGHFPLGDHYGQDGIRIEIQSYRMALPDLAITIDDLLARDDKVVRRFKVTGTYISAIPGIAARPQHLALEGIGIDCLAQGKLYESWVKIDPWPR